MALQDISPTEGDFKQTNWEGVLDSASERTCEMYAELYAQKAREAGEEGDTVACQVFELIHHACSLVLNLDSPTEPLGRSFPFGPRWGGISVENFQDCHLLTLQAIVHEITDPELRARIADILWYHRIGSHQMAELAVRSYLESSEILQDPVDWPLCAKRIERALDLAAALGKKNQPFCDVIAHIERVLDKYQGEDPLFLSARLMEMLQGHGQGDPEKYCSIAEKAALRAETEESGIKWHKARGYWTVKARWHRMQGDDEDARKCQLLVAQTFVKEAEDRVEQQAPGSYSLAAGDIQQAIECLRRVTGTKQCREALHKQLLRYEKKVVEEFKSYSISIDVTQAAREAAERVEGKTLSEALLTLALMPSSPKVEELRERVQDFSRKYGLTYLPPMRQFSEDGRVVACRPSLYGSEEDAAWALRAEMLKQARSDQGLIAHAVIQPALAQIQMEHGVRVSDVLNLVQHSPFVPPGREYLYARGLHAGLNGDLVTAVHLLCPQVEHSVRVILERCDVRVSGLDDERVQEMHLLKANLNKPELTQILGEDIVFDLQGLLVEPFGYNLRNRVAHGLMGIGEFYSLDALYLWWLVLRLCLAPLYGRLYARPDSGECDDSAARGHDDGSS
jgi:hypothetical protein